jgi:vacuolar-type H+-ATPase subunit H
MQGFPDGPGQTEVAGPDPAAGPPQTAAASDSSHSPPYPELMAQGPSAPPPMPAEPQGPGGAASELGQTSFPIVLRGYDRMAVEGYVARVVATVAELEAARSPEGAVSRALDQVGEETSSILKRAQETADEMIAKARAESEERVRNAERETEAMVRDAETRARELDTDNDALWAQRRQLIEDLRGLASELLRVSDEAVERLPPPPGRARAIVAARTGVPDAGRNGVVEQPTQAMSPLELPDGAGYTGPP